MQKKGYLLPRQKTPKTIGLLWPSCSVTSCKGQQTQCRYQGHVIHVPWYRFSDFALSLPSKEGCSLLLLLLVLLLLSPFDALPFMSKEETFLKCFCAKSCCGNLGELFAASMLQKLFKASISTLYWLVAKKQYAWLGAWATVSLTLHSELVSSTVCFA